MSKGSARFSIVTVTRDNLDGLRQTSEGVLAQDFEDLQWLVIDGASRDGTLGYLGSITDPRLAYISEQDDGIFDAMQKGLALATGEYVCFMNAGDTFANARVLSQIDALIGTATPSLVYGDSIEADGPRRFYKPARVPHHNRFVMFTHHQAQFYRMETVRELGGYDLSYTLSCDWVLTTRLLARGQPLRAPFAICLFERGGITQREDRRRLLNAELFRVYREEQKHSLAASSLYWLVKVSINRVRNLVPWLYDAVRYPRRISAQS